LQFRKKELPAVDIASGDRFGLFALLPSSAPLPLTGPIEQSRRQCRAVSERGRRRPKKPSIHELKPSRARGARGQATGACRHSR